MSHFHKRTPYHSPRSKLSMEWNYTILKAMVAIFGLSDYQELYVVQEVLWTDLLSQCCPRLVSRSSVDSILWQIRQVRATRLRKPEY